MNGKIEHRQHERRWVYLNDDMQVMGELNYRVDAERHWHIHHTGVDASLQGQGIAKRLVDLARAYCQSHDIELSSSCSYATAVLARPSTS